MLKTWQKKKYEKGEKKWVSSWEKEIRQDIKDLEAWLLQKVNMPNQTCSMLPHSETEIIYKSIRNNLL